MKDTNKELLNVFDLVNKLKQDDNDVIELELDDDDFNDDSDIFTYDVYKEYYKLENGKWVMDYCELYNVCSNQELANELCKKLNKKQEPNNTETYKIEYNWDIG